MKDPFVIGAGQKCVQIFARTSGRLCETYVGKYWLLSTAVGNVSWCMGGRAILRKIFSTIRRKKNSPQYFSDINHIKTGIVLTMFLSMFMFGL